MAQSPLPASPTTDADPSMDEILASIRRILSDEEKAAKDKASNDGVFMLDPSMIVEETESHTPEQQAPPAPHPAPALSSDPAPMPELAKPAAVPLPEPQYAPAPPPMPMHLDHAPASPSPASASHAPPGDPLIAPEAANAAATSVGSLMRTLVAERNAAIHRGGPTIEDVVREEIRPLLKNWLDTHLPGVVERLVRAEIERVMGRVGT